MDGEDAVEVYGGGAATVPGAYPMAVSAFFGEP